MLRPGFILQNEHSLLQLQSLACGPGRLSSVESLLALSSFYVIGSNELSIQVCAEHIGSPQNIGTIQKNQLIAGLQVYILVFSLFSDSHCLCTICLCALYHICDDLFTSLLNAESSLTWISAMEASVSFICSAV